jgi:hypothetical protein
MPAIPLAIDSYQRMAGFQPETVCKNMYVEEDKSGASPDKLMRIDRPGLSTFVTLPAPVRGLFNQDGVLGGGTYAVAGSRFYSISIGESTDLGGIGNGDRVQFAANYEKLFVLSAFVAFQYDGLTMDGIEMPEQRDVVDIDTLNNFLILGCPDGRFYWLEPGATEVDELSFATAEGSPDGLVAVRRLVDELWFFGRSSIEVWQPTGNDDAPFLRAGGRVMERGCLSRDTVLRFDNSLLWVGDDGVVYRAANVPQRISNHGIEERIRERSDLPSAMVVEADGHKFYVLKIPGQGSFAYDASTEQWSEFSSAGGTEWKPHTSAQVDGAWLVGDRSTGAVWMFDPDAATDAGTPIERVLTGTVALMGRPGRNDSLAVGAGGSADFTIRLRWKDGQDDWPEDYEELEVRAPADIATIYRLGMPDQPFRTFELSIVAPVKARISGAMVNEAWR